jgi:hypothetical protein
MMKRFLFFSGFAAGFLCGSKAGRAPYAEIRARVRSVARRPPFQAAVQEARDHVNHVVEGVGERVSSPVDPVAGSLEGRVRSVAKSSVGVH